MAYKKRSGGAGVDWFPRNGDVATGALASGAQGTVFDEAVQNIVNTQAYGSGALVGLRLWVRTHPDAGLFIPTEIVCMILPNGLAVPAVGTSAQKKQNEKYIWFQQLGKVKSAAGAVSEPTFEHDVEIHSVRRFDMNDRLVLVHINRDVAAFSAVAGRTSYSLDAYVRED